MDTIARVRRAFHVQGWSVNKIVRELHVSRNTVRKILRSDETDFSYERERQPLPKTGAWKAEIERFLATNESKPSRERLTLIRIYEELRALGYDGSYDAIRRYAKTWRRTGEQRRRKPMCRSTMLPAKPTSSTGAMRSC